MPLFIRICTYVVVFAVLALIGTAIWPSWPGDLGLDVWNVASLSQQIEQDRQTGEAMEADDQAVLRRLQIKELIVSEMLAGRLTMLEAAARFQALHRGDERFAKQMAIYFKGQNEEERFCRSVMDFARMRLQQMEPEREAETMAVYERELQAAMNRDGLVVLPELP